ncbi:8895_t:CDS:10 [Funneliformis mosseae]|uniref:8895_t:CDS:1 n=2 Tax=Funneliformis TaxID=1117308 RepID=A0A9N8WTD8_FUNMO|nr:8895_t:CDS:10 [Funneliformis mosseae]
MSKTKNTQINVIPSNEVNIRLIGNSSAYEKSVLANNEKDHKGNQRQLVIIDKPDTPKDIALHAITGGLKSYVMAHGIRGGVNFLLNLLTVFRKRKGSIYKIYKAFLHGFFGKDAVRFGVSFGGFSFLWKLINNGLRYVRKKDDHWNGFVAGSIAGISILAEKRERRISIAQQLFVRALQALYNAGHAREYFRIPHGDALLFILTTAQVLYAYTMRPNTIPKDFLNFMIITARVPKKTLDMNFNLRRGLPLNKEEAINLVKSLKGTKNALEVAYNLPPRPVSIPCELVHPKFDSCVYTNIERFYQVFRRIAPVYATLNFVPMIAFKFQQLAKDPTALIQKSTFNTIRSSTFLATFVASYQSHICLHRNIIKYFNVKWDSKYLYWWAGFSSALAIFIEHKNRRADLALYVLPKAAESWYKIMCQKNWIFELHRTADVWFFSVAMGIIMTAYQHEPESLSPMMQLGEQIPTLMLEQYDTEKSLKNLTIKERLKWYQKQKKYTTDKVLCYGLFVFGFFCNRINGNYDEFSTKDPKKECTLQSCDHDPHSDYTVIRSMREERWIYTASFFCTELMLFIEEYQFLKRRILRYYYYESIEIDNLLLNDNAAISQDICTPWDVCDPGSSLLIDEKMLRDIRFSTRVEMEVSPVTVSIHDTLMRCLPVNVIDSTVRNVTAKVNTEDYRLETAKEEVLYLLYGPDMRCEVVYGQDEKNPLCFCVEDVKRRLKTMCLVIDGDEAMRCDHISSILHASNLNVRNILEINVGLLENRVKIDTSPDYSQSNFTHVTPYKNIHG